MTDIEKDKDSCIKPSDAITLFNDATAHHEQGQFDLAIKAYQDALKLDPEYPDAAHLAGLASFQIGRRVEAVNFLRTALASKPDSVQILNDLGSIMTMVGGLQQAFELYTQVIELCPDSPDAHCNLAAVLYDTGHFFMANRQNQMT